MNNQYEKYQTITIDLPVVMRKSFYITLIALFICLVIQWLLYPNTIFMFSWRRFLGGLSIVSIGYIVLIVLHEFFHLLGFHLFGKVPWRLMKVGVDFKKGIAYATTTKMLTNAAMKKALLLPFWMTGVLPAIAGLLCNQTSLLILGALLIGGAAGDFEMYRKLKLLPNHWMIQDDPEQPRLHVYQPVCEETIAKEA